MRSKSPTSWLASRRGRRSLRARKAPRSRRQATAAPRAPQRLLLQPKSVPPGAPALQCGRFSFPLQQPLIMGVVNITPDSFSDGGRFFDAKTAIAHARALAAEGADIIDLGGESSRPGAEAVSEDDEL